MLQNAYFLAKIDFDTAENEPAKKSQKLQKFGNFTLLSEGRKVAEGADRGVPGGRRDTPAEPARHAVPPPAERQRGLWRS